MNGHELAASIFGRETFLEVPCFYEDAVGLWIGGSCVSWVGVTESAQVLADWKPVRVAGIGFVCTHEAHRHRGYMHMLMEVAHKNAVNHGIQFAMLNTGSQSLYEPLGYWHAANLPAEWMVCELSDDAQGTWDETASIDFMGRTW